MALFDVIASTRRIKYTRSSTRRRRHGRQSSLEVLEVRALLAAFVVDNLDDSGDGSLRQAIEDANAAPGADFISFDVAGTIELTSGALPAITGPVRIDGTTAPGFAARQSKTPVVEVDADGFAGLAFNRGASGSVLQSLGIVHAGSAGVTLNTPRITLLGNFIGVELDGTTAAGNNGDGVAIHDSLNTIGGTPGLGGVEAEFRNVISANNGNGIGIYGFRLNTVVANFIGTNADGDSGVGNAGNGILLTGGTRSNTIGGTTPLPDGPPIPDNYQGKPADGNVISGNGQNGVLLTDRARDNLLAGNFIGTDLSGNAPIGNALDGVAIVDRSHNNSLRGARFTVPGNEDAFVFYNVVSGNGENGLRIHNSNGTVVHANFFGLGADNNTRVGNALNGVLVEGSSANTQFGGLIPLGNVASANGRHGIEIRDRVRGFVSDNTFAGTAAFNPSTEFGNALDGLHITSTGGNIVSLTSVLSGNGDDGVEISGRARGVTIQQTVIGLNGTLPPGLTPLPNLDNGVEIGGDAHHNFIGLTNPHFSGIRQNTIGGNGNNGVAIIGNAHRNQVFGSFIGVNLFGENPIGSDVGNTNAGVFLGGNSHHNIIGGTRDGDANLISANGGSGIELSGATHHNRILNNLVGGDRLGRPGVGNRGAGVLLDNGTHHNILIGNLARQNSGSGFHLSNAHSNTFRRNTARSNDGDGFLIEHSKFNTFRSNTATANLSDGFHVVASDFNRFLFNSAIANLGDGFHVDDSDFNIFRRNRSILNEGFGYFVDEILANVFRRNECALNGLGGSNQPGIC